MLLEYIQIIVSSLIVTVIIKLSATYVGGLF